MFPTIFERTSIRTYQKNSLKSNDITLIQEVLSSGVTTTPPFGYEPIFHLIQAEDLDSKKIGTYGFVKNAEWFFFGTTKNTQEALIDYGYVFEEIILKLTKQGFGTVWLAGTFKRRQFEKYVTNDLFIPAISPVGKPEKDRRSLDKIIRRVSKGNHRLDFNQLFFNDLGESLECQEWIKEVLEGVRRGPSASNKQPWRIVVGKNALHVYLNRTIGYASKLGFDIQLLDIGIALKHLECGLKHFNKNFKRIKSTDQDHHTWTYIITYQISD